MKLFLSSVGIPQADAYQALFGNKRKPRVGLVSNAWDTHVAQTSQVFITQASNQLSTLDIQVQPLNLLDYEGKQDALQATLESLDGLWVTGGNSFYLNWAVHQAGLHNIIASLCRNGLVYGGESAGAILATPTLHGVEFVDDANEAPTIFWDGLRLVDFGIVPHWGNAQYAEPLASCRQEMEEHVPVKLIGDRQCLVIVDNQLTLLG